MSYQINIPAVIQLRDFVKQRETTLNLRMNDYVDQCDPENHFCATSACLAGWGATTRLQEDHPILKPIYTKLDEWTNHWPNEKSTQPVNHLLRSISSIYSMLVSDTNNTPDIDDIMRDINRVQVDDYTNLSDLLGDLDNRFKVEGHIVSINHRPGSPVWHFLFGSFNTDAPEHALWRMDYVIKHNDVPFTFSRNHMVASNLTWGQAVDLLKTEFPDENMYDYISEPLNTSSSELTADELDIEWEFNGNKPLVEFITKIINKSGTTND